jgi:hypothetical protein
MKRLFSMFNDFPVWACFTDGGGSNDGGAGDDGKDDGKGSGDNNANDGGQQSDGSSKDDKPFATFPNKEAFDARIARSTKTELESMAKELGFDGVDAMKSAAAKAKEIEDANKTELEKEREARQKAESTSQAALDKANTRLINAELKVFASQAGYADPSDAVALVNRSDLKVDDDGNVTGAKEAVEALIAAKPHLKGSKDTNSSATGDSSQGGETETKGGFNEAFRAAVFGGRK